MSDLPRELERAFPPGGILLMRGDETPLNPDPRFQAAGAYLLLICIENPLEINFKNQRQILPRGWVIYTGSARGPGGIQARVARHMRADKKPHWHIDKITMTCLPTAAIGYPGANECELADLLIEQRDFTTPIPGFGSTDCRTCVSHLLSWKPGKSARE